MKHKMCSILMTLLLISTTSCVYFPYSNQLWTWAAESCGRKTVGTRICSGTVTLFIIPAWLVTKVIDLPLGFVELIFGYAPFHDALVHTPIDAVVINDEKHIDGKQKGEKWIIKKLSEDSPNFYVKRMIDNKVVEEYVMSPHSNRELEVYAPSKSIATKKIPAKYQVDEQQPSK
ncbi:MAG: hypothetical protein CMP10_10650 [Zetaproteobacteria bacterium]|nr:hypothetical protein [Pseudobdellovibrionaceae bacterium]